MSAHDVEKRHARDPRKASEQAAMTQAPKMVEVEKEELVHG
jgi:hypothetical protein